MSSGELGGVAGLLTVNWNGKNGCHAHVAQQCGHAHAPQAAEVEVNSSSSCNKTTEPEGGVGGVATAATASWRRVFLPAPAYPEFR